MPGKRYLSLILGIACESAGESSLWHLIVQIILSISASSLLCRAKNQFSDTDIHILYLDVQLIGVIYLYERDMQYLLCMQRWLNKCVL